MRAVSLFVLFIILCSNSIFSQSITGTVKDKSTSELLENVKVTIINNTTGITDSVFTNNLGRWTYNLLTSVGSDVNQPENFSVSQNFPNPFNPSTKIQFAINTDEYVEIAVHNILGELIDYKEQFLQAGAYSIDWMSKGAAGVYFYTIKTGENSLTKKMIQLDGSNSIGGLQTINSISSGKSFISSKPQAQSLKIIYSKVSHLSDSVDVQVNGGENLLVFLTSYHSSFTMIDLHNDVLEVMISDPDYHLRTRHNYNHTDIPRLEDGGVDIQFFSVWVSPTQYTNYFQQAQVMLDVFNFEMNDNPQTIKQAFTYQEASDINNEGKIAAVIGVEGGHHIENSIDNLVFFYEAGMRYMTITWNNSTDWAISAQDPLSLTQGLSDFGRQVIRTMDSLGIIIDVSHTGIKTIQDILEVTTNPIIATHSGARALKDHYRNLYDSQIIDIANSGGVIGVVFYPPFLTYQSTAYIDDVIAHIDYIKNLVGIDYVAVGSDFDGIGTNVPVGLEDVSKFPNLTNALFDHGYSRNEIEKILGLNFKRVFEQVCGYNKDNSTKELISKASSF